MSYVSNSVVWFTRLTGVECASVLPAASPGFFHLGGGLPLLRLSSNLYLQRAVSRTAPRASFFSPPIGLSLHADYGPVPPRSASPKSNILSLLC
jgi:hypothetical protein